MTHYLVHYSLGKDNEYVYPQSVIGVVWKSTIYHYTERVMIGETDDKVKADRKKVIALKPKESKKLVEKYNASYPKPEGLPFDVKSTK